MQALKAFGRNSCGRRLPVNDYALHSARADPGSRSLARNCKQTTYIQARQRLGAPRPHTDKIDDVMVHPTRQRHDASTRIQPEHIGIVDES